MTTKPTPEGESPSAPSLLFPQLRYSRRGSLASLSSTTQVDKETLSQALDHIHNAACQSETLTTFNEYTSAPSSSSGAEGKGIASELQGGLSGLYNRFKASVGNVRDVVTLGHDDGDVDDVSVRSSKSGLSSPAPIQGKFSEPAKYTNPSNVTSNTTFKSEAGQQASCSDAVAEAVVPDSGRHARSSKVLSGSTSTSARSFLASDVIPKSSLGPLKQVTVSSAVSPAVAEVNVTAVKERGNTGDENIKNTKSIGTISPESITIPRMQEEDLTSRSNQTTFRSRAGEGQRSDAPNPRRVKPTASKNLPNRAEMVSRGSSEQTSTRGLRAARSSRSTTDDGSSSWPSGVETVSKGDNSLVQRLPNDSSVVNEVTTMATFIGSQNDSSNDLTAAPHSDPHPNFAKNSNSQHLEPASRKLLVSQQQSNAPPPNLSLSRASSPETTGIAPLTSPIPLLPSHLQSVETKNSRTGNSSQTKIMVPEESASDARTMNVFSQIKSKILNREYWMKDENARDCFYCGDPFSTFRRKHHCRTCGQIFDAKCTSLLPGAYFGQSGSLRVCKPCEEIINGYDDSSEFSDDGNFSTVGRRPRHGSTGASDVLGSPGAKFSPSSAEEFGQSPKQPDLTIPTMAIPATRKAGGESSKIVVETDLERPLLRPSSSRSLKSSLSSRPYSSSHKRHNSRHLNQRAFKTVIEDNAPFHQNPVEGKRQQSRLTAFHDDNIIDPDLAPFLSDEGSSGDEQIGIMAALSSEGLSHSFDSEKGGLAGLLASSKKGRSKFGDKSISGVTFASRDTDNNSLSSSRAANHSRSSKRRNVGLGNMYLRPSPRSHRASTLLPSFGSHLHESSSNSALGQVSSSNSTVVGSRMIRSSSMRGASAPAVELNNASLHHVRKLLRQLLQDANIPSIASWEKALVPILLQATDDVNPDVQNGDDIDIRTYVKLKKIPGSRPGDTSYVSGLVFTKNLALKSMPRTLSHPSILILTFPLEYARHQRHFMSLEPVIRQEREFLQNLVNRIVALRPQLLLVERNVSGLALDFLEQAKIATAYNVKPSVLAAVSRCARTRIISSIDKLAIKPAQAGTCSDFYLKTYVNGGRKKTYMFLSGCAKELGCTIILRGGSNATLAKVKRITDFMVYVVYNLKLETCLMRDEFALIPSTTGVGSLSTARVDQLEAQEAGTSAMLSANALAKASIRLQGVGTISDPASSNAVDSGDARDSRTGGDGPEKPKSNIPNELSLPEDVPMPTFYGDMVKKHETKILSASPFVKFMEPYLLRKAREEERRLTYFKGLRNQDVLEDQRIDEAVEPQKFDLIRPEMIHKEFQATSKKVREVLHAIHDAEYDRALHNYQTQSKQWEMYIAGNADLFDPYAHQNIAVLYSVVCTVTTVPCSGPDLLALAFYSEHETDEDFEADCTLGQYVEDLCLQANTVCTANGCERKMLDHHRQYVHGEAQLSVFAERYPCKLRGLQDTILMWSCCRICGKETQVMPMSESTWKYSFGKYLELSFWSGGLQARAGICPHDLHRNHLRYFGFKDIALRLHYDPINLLEIIVPRVRITWKVEDDLRFKNDLFTKIEDRLNRYMTSVRARIKSIRVETVIPNKTDLCKQEVEKLLKRASDEHRFLIRKLQEMYMDSKHYEIISLNRVLKTLQEKVAEWDNAFADFDQNFFPSEKDIRRLATLQLKKIFLDRDDSTTSLTSTDEGSGNSISEDILNEKTSPEVTPALPPLTRKMSPEKAHDMLTSVVEKNVSSPESNKVDKEHRDQSHLPLTGPGRDPTDIQTSIQDLERDDVRHLDLAVSSEFPEDAVHDRKASVSGPDAGNLKQENIRSDLQVEIGSPSLLATNKPTVSNEIFISESTSKDFAFTEQSKSSGIPRPSEISVRRSIANVSPPLVRAQSQPAHLRKAKSGNGGKAPLLLSQASEHNKLSKGHGETEALAVPASLTIAGEKKLSDRAGLGVIKPSGISTHSMIPRSVASRKKDSQVSTLAKHFEQLSREFEKERIRERRLRASKSKQARAYPLASSKPIVEIYRNVREAVEEREPSDEEVSPTEPSQSGIAESSSTLDMSGSIESHTRTDESHPEDTTAETTETDDNNHPESYAGSDIEGEGRHHEGDHPLLDDISVPGTAGDHHALSPTEAQLDLKLDLPKHEKSSLMRILTNFWAERSASGWQPLDYPLAASDHVFADSDIIVREDEPSSLVAFALSSEDYCVKLRSITAEAEALEAEKRKGPSYTPGPETYAQDEVERALLRPVGTHLKYQFHEGSAKMLCKVFYAEQFDALRRKCGIADRFVESVSRCLKWDSKGGKTKSVFLKTLDDRFVLKSLSPIETQAFLRFAPAYFRFVSEYFFHELPSCIAKMLGFYQVIIKNPATGVEFNWFLVVMENLFYDRAPTRIFDLKGSMRNRRIQSTGEQNEVLLDENMVEFIYESPLFAREHAKRLLRATVFNDTLFLQKQNVMDYSLMIAIDENRKELVVGMIDCIRTYTWDKKLESWIKDRGKNRPTVTSPRDYKQRFREAMGRYILQAPKWVVFSFRRGFLSCIRLTGEVQLLAPVPVLASGQRALENAGSGTGEGWRRRGNRGGRVMCKDPGAWLRCIGTAFLGGIPGGIAVRAYIGSEERISWGRHRARSLTELM